MCSPLGDFLSVEVEHLGGEEISVCPSFVLWSCVEGRLAEQARLREIRSGEVSAEQVHAGEVRPDEGRLGEVGP